MKTPDKKKSEEPNEENKTPGFNTPDVQKGLGKDDIDTSESDLTEDDLDALGPVDLSMDGGDDEDLKHRVHPVNFSGDDLDVPGAELDDLSEDLGSEDEENNSYSLGGDGND